MKAGRYRVGILVGAIAMILLVAGVATSVAADTSHAFEQETTVNADGEVEQIKAVETLSEEDYEMTLSFAEEEGYDSVGEWIASETIETHPAYNDGTGWDEPIADGYEIHTEYTEIDVDELAEISITADDDSLTFESTETDGADQTDELDLEYTLVLPDEITATNADEVDGTTAVWDLSEHSEPLFAQTGTVENGEGADEDATDDGGAADDSEAEGDAADDSDADDDVADDGDTDDADSEVTAEEDADDDGDDEATDDSIPGFGAAAAVAGLLAATFLVARRSN